MFISASDYKNKAEAPKSKKNSSFISASDFKSKLPKKKKSTLGRVASGIGDVAKAIVSPVATTVARPFQAAAMLGGASTEDIDKFTLGGLIAPTPKSGGDVIKDVGRSIQTAAFGLPVTKSTSLFNKTINPISTKVGTSIIGSNKLTPQAIKSAKLPSTAIGTAIEGGIFGLGADLEQGSSGKNTLLGAGIGGALPYVGAGLSKAFGKTTSKVAPVIEKTTTKTDDIITKTPKEKTVKEIAKESKNEYPFEDDIFQKAKKYKSAEEFVEAQGTPLYHGTDSNTAKIIRQSGFKSGSEGYVSLTDNKKIAQQFAEGRSRAMGGKPEIIEVDPKSVGIERNFNPNDLESILTQEREFIVRPENEKNIQLFKTKSQLIDIFNKAQKVTPEQPIQPKLPETEYNNAKSKIDNSFVDYKDYDRAEEFVGKDPEYITQTVKGREISGLESIRTKGKDNAIKEALGINPISPDAGYTASSIKETLIKSGLLTDDEVARLLRSKAVESFAGSSLQSVSPLQSFMNKANEAIKKTYQNKIVANKKTVRSLFEGLEC